MRGAGEERPLVFHRSHTAGVAQIDVSGEPGALGGLAARLDPEVLFTPSMAS